MPRVTERLIKTIKPSGKRIMIPDDSIKGFNLRVSATGRTTFVFRYRIGRRQCLYTIGSTKAMNSSQARVKAKEIAGNVASCIDPNDKKRAIRDVPNFRKVTEDYLSTVEKKSLSDDKSKIDRVLIPKWGSRPIDSINANDVRKLLKSLADKGLSPATRNRYRALVSVVFNYAAGGGYIKREMNPVLQIKPLQENNARDRFLSESELSDFITSLETKPQNAANAMRMLLVTGARCGNVFSMKWDDVDLDYNIWTIPETKSGKKQRVPLTTPALDILGDQNKRRVVGNKYVFQGKRKGSHLTTVQKIFEQTIKEAKISDFKLHDLRHTFASYLVKAGVSLYVTGKLLGHSDSSMTARYAHLTDESLQKASGVGVSDIMNLKDERNIVNGVE